MRSRRAFLAIVAVPALILGTVACSASPSAAPAKPADQSTLSNRAEPKPAAPAPTAVAAAKPAEAAKPAAAPPAPAVAAKPAEAAKPAGDTDARSAGGAAASVAQAQPPRPAPTAGPGSTVPAPAPTPVKPADAAPVIPAQTGRMVIYTTELSILVANPAQLINALGDVMGQSGGYIAGVESKDESGVPVTTIRLKFPPDRYDATMRQIRGLAVEVTNEKATTQDVTEEFSDVQTQLASLEASYARLLDLMSKAQNMDEILKIQKELAQTKIQIDRLKGRETFLQRSAELATVTVTARPAEAVLSRAYSTMRTSLRRTEAQRAQTVTAIENSKTGDEETALREKLGETTLAVEQLQARMADIEAKAKAANISLPQPAPEDTSLVAMTDKEMYSEYMRLAVAQRQAEGERDRLGREMAKSPSAETALLMRESQANVQTLSTQKVALLNRAKRANVNIQELPADQIAQMAGIQPEPTNQTGPVALVVLAALVLGGLTLVFINRMRRRPPTAPRPTMAG